jgi:multimeric flavodoxin WrbA
MSKILAINGSYRKGGVTDQLVKIMSGTLQGKGVDVEIIFLRELAEKLFILTNNPIYPEGFLERPCSLQKIHVKANNDEKKAKP